MEVLQLLSSPIVEICKSAVTPLKRQIGYLVRYKRNVQKLREKVEELRWVRVWLQTDVDAARRNLKSIRRVVELWFERVDMETTGDETMVRLMNGEAIEMINHQCFKGWCSFNTCYSIGRIAEKKMVIIDKLINEGKSFNDIVSDPSVPLGMELVYPTDDFQDFTSREATMNQVMATLEDKNTYLFGVSGMGGVGKTMLMNQVSRRVIKAKLFNAVVMIAVSQNVDLKRIQAEIAYKLGFKQVLEEVDDISTRAAMLTARLKQEKKILVILDDIWSAINLRLSDLGIPYGDTHHHKGCKVVITTRNLDVCNSMNTQKNIEVGVLSDEDSWQLFKKNAGGVVDSPALGIVAREVAKECAGLPIALVTLGNALKNKDNLVWEDTVLQLRKSDFTYIDGMNSKVFSLIKLSYDYLGNEIIRKIFLLCCLFPEDHKISMDELMMYVIGDDGLLEDLETLKQMRGRLHTILDKLVASSLLLGYKQKDDGGITYVCMHDVVRDVAISIASKEEKGFFVKAGAGLRNWPDKGIWLLSRTAKCLQLSLMKNEIGILPDQPELPHLMSLSLEGNKPLKEIPHNFFQGMKAVATLNLGGTGISSLPSSLSCLLNLRTLNLDDCNFYQSVEISQIGELKRLEILSLQNCNLQRLPKEIGRLTNLKMLNLSYNLQLDIIPPNVISSLSRLEELIMIRSFNGWEVEGWRDGSKASLAEVASLPRLISVHLSLSKKLITEYINHEKTVQFSISFGDGFSAKGSSLSPKKFFNFECDLTASPPICHSMKVLIGRAEDLTLRYCIGLKSLEQLITGAGFKNMKTLLIEGCNEMKYLMNVVEEEIPSNALASLELLIIESMNKLNEIFHGPLPVGFLCNLKGLHVTKCKDIVRIFASNSVKRAPMLRTLLVERCRKLKTVFHLLEENDHEGSNAITVPKLSKITLRGLPNLEAIWKGVIPPACLQNLKVMYVDGCNKLSYLFSLDMARCLQQLETLEIFNCYQMVEIISSDERMLVFPQNTTSSCTIPPPQTIVPNLHEKKPIVFSKLKNLHIYELKILSSFHHGSSVYDWPSLEYLDVSMCEKLKKLPLTHQNAPKLKRINGDSDGWFRGLEWESPSVVLHLQPLFQRYSRPLYSAPLPPLQLDDEPPRD